MGSADQTPASPRISLEGQSLIFLRAAPLTSLELTDLEHAWSSDHPHILEITLKGSASNLPPGTPCLVNCRVWGEAKKKSETHLSLMTTLDLADSWRPESGAAACSLTFEVDALKARLFQSGSLGFGVHPHFPGCPSVELPKGKRIPFTHTIHVDRKGPATEVGAALGSFLWVTPLLDPKDHKDHQDSKALARFGHCRLRWVVEEADRGEDKRTEKREEKDITDLREELNWDAPLSAAQKKLWPLGCSPKLIPLELRYAEKKEVGDFEFSDRLEISSGEPEGRKKEVVWVEVTGTPRRDPRHYAKPALSSLTCALHEEGYYVLRGSFKGFADGASLWLEGTLWGWKGSAEGAVPAQPMGQPFLLEVSAEDFEIPLGPPPAFAAPPDWTFFCTLSFPSYHSPTAWRPPFAPLAEFKDLQPMAGIYGSATSGAATHVASEELQERVVRIPQFAGPPEVLKVMKKSVTFKLPVFGDGEYWKRAKPTLCCRLEEGGADVLTTKLTWGQPEDKLWGVLKAEAGFALEDRSKSEFLSALKTYTLWVEVRKPEATAKGLKVPQPIQKPSQWLKLRIAPSLGPLKPQWKSKSLEVRCQTTWFPRDQRLELRCLDEAGEELKDTKNKLLFPKSLVEKKVNSREIFVASIKGKNFKAIKKHQAKITLELQAYNAKASDWWKVNPSKKKLADLRRAP